MFYNSRWEGSFGGIAKFMQAKFINPHHGLTEYWLGFVLLQMEEKARKIRPKQGEREHSDFEKAMLASGVKPGVAGAWGGLFDMPSNDEED
jgi:hypothetical protein